MPHIYSARWILPITSPRIENGAVAIEGGKIVAVGSRSDLAKQFPAWTVEDFGDAAILPGLINTHSHLELTVMRGFLEAEEHDFFSWLRKLTIARMAMTEEDLFVSAACGAIEAARAGITFVGDSSSLAVQSMKALREIGLRGTVYQESFGPDPKLAQQNFADLKAQVATMREFETDYVRAGVSPHAPYTVSAPQLEMISRFAIDQTLPLMMHAAESEAERQLFLTGEGPFADGLRKREIDWQAPGISTIQYLDRHGVMAAAPLLAHCINVDDADIQLIKKRGAGVAHCSKSNAKLSHGRAPFARLLARDVNVGLGSDSVASNNTCDILEEGRFATLGSRFAATDREETVTAEKALYAATFGGARALGSSDRIGALQAGMAADLTIVGLNGAHQQPVQTPEASLIFSSSGRDVIATVVGGEKIYERDRITNAGEADLMNRLSQIRARLASLA